MVRKRKILTVLLLSAGCGTSSSPRSAPPTVAAPAPAPGAALALVPAVAATPPAAAAAPTPPSDPDAGPRALLDLRVELYRGGRAAVQAAPARFRALCDAEGYPLVGNIASKGVSYGVRDHCAEVRAALVRGDA